MGKWSRGWLTFIGFFLFFTQFKYGYTLQRSSHQQHTFQRAPLLSSPPSTPSLLQTALFQPAFKLARLSCYSCHIYGRRSESRLHARKKKEKSTPSPSFRGEAGNRRDVNDGGTLKRVSCWAVSEEKCKNNSPLSLSRRLDGAALVLTLKPREHFSITVCTWRVAHFLHRFLGHKLHYTGCNLLCMSEGKETPDQGCESFR